MTKVWWKIHGWCGTYCGGFLAFVLITGGFAMLAPPIERWENARAAPFTPASFDPSALAETDASTINGITIPADDSEAVRLSIENTAEPSNPFLPGGPWQRKSVFLHPVSGAVLGKIDDGRRLSEFFATVHIRLFAGTPGRNLVGLFGFALLVNSLTGLLLLGKFLRNKSLWIIRKKSARLATADLHMLGGTLLLLPALVFAITGFWLGMQGRLMEWTGMERPGIHHREPVIDAVGDASLPLDYAAVLAATKKVYPELIVRQLRPSSDGQASIVATGRTKGMFYERLSQTVVLDKRDLAVLDVHKTSEAGLGDKLFFLQEGLHFGEFWGWWSRLPYLLLGVLLGLLPVSGYLIRRLRRKQPLRPVFAWTAFSAGYLAVALLAVKTQGIPFTMAWGTVALWVFVAGLLIAAAVRKVREAGQT